MSQSQLATRLGVSFQQVQKYEKGVNKIAANRLSQIAGFLDVPVMFFYPGNGKASAIKHQTEVESLMFMDSRFTLRLLRAYTTMDKKVARQFVLMMEVVAGIAPVD